MKRYFKFSVVVVILLIGFINYRQSLKNGYQGLTQFRYLKNRVKKIESPDIVFLGSNTSETIDSQLLAEYRFFDASLETSSVTDIYSVFNLLEKVSKRPGTVIIGINPKWFVNEPVPANNELERELLGMLDRFDYEFAEVFIKKLKNKSSIIQFIRTFAKKESSTLRDDSMMYFQAFIQYLMLKGVKVYLYLPAIKADEKTHNYIDWLSVQLNIPLIKSKNALKNQLNSDLTKA